MASLELKHLYRKKGRLEAKECGMTKPGKAKGQGGRCGERVGCVGNRWVRGRE